MAMDLESAIANAFFGIFYNKGEICTAGSRLLVEQTIHDAVIDGLVNYLSQIKMGNPLDPDVLFGPLADAGQLEKVMQYVEVGKQEGATLRYGGERFYPDGSKVHTRDIKKAMRMANAMQAGTCWINCYNVFDASVPFGGYKSSGFGRENGKEVMENYTQTKAIWIDLS
jgi:acyl-CoA reductase-like NAD-dependent aldehyde dehydrogenase